jgi:hypothetical protein
MNTLTLNTQLVMFIMTLFIPAVVGLITKYTMHPFLKFFVNLVVSTAASVINVAITADGTAVISKDSLVAACYTVVISTLLYLGLYKPLDANAKMLPSFGLELVPDPNTKMAKGA